jgi:hypothetical protein
MTWVLQSKPSELTHLPQRFIQELFTIVNTSSLDFYQERANLCDESRLLGPNQDAKAPNNLNLIEARHFSSALIVNEETIGMQTLVESHGFQLALPQAGHCNDECLEVDLSQFVP